MCGAGEGVGAYNENFGLIAIEFQKVSLHPVFYVSQAGGEGGVGDGGDGFGGKVELCVVRITVEM